ncbi:dienelactone hydrolase family protein [Aliifodinibius sp. S!AR15-10]|uniref:dienelactone hydrolase family protein n=1 Tax=Aliifodinibius sp. S!AR15-10 TaxID=2950437 RepID=UPI0028646FE4|nr:dienelactone hydrolase family protein [Aliifodinibius sp. S!AR15-10]MDR8392964.1 dienelactone hydrolase family protein [Aliifodinibius sp. S!AR15-10]
MKQLGKLLFGASLVMLLAGCSSDKKDYLDRMAEEHDGDVPVENAASEISLSSAVTGEEVTYATVNGEDITGYLTKPEGMDQNRPGLIVIHEWWGLNDNIRMMTDKLAGEGYTALAVDLYNGRVAETPENAGKYAGSVNSEEAIDNLKQAYNYLAEQQGAANIGTIGWCFGGGWSLQTALALPQQVDATVIYYGRLIIENEQLKKLQMPILGIFGAEDSGIPPEQVKKFEAALNEVGVTNSIHIYDGAGHAFANPSGNRYQKEAAGDAWTKTTAFFEKHLK